MGIIFNLYHSLSKFRRRQIDFFLFFPENRIWHFMQTVSKCRLLKYLPRVLSVKVRARNFYFNNLCLFMKKKSVMEVTFTTLWANIADNKFIIVLVFFLENRIWHFLQRQFAWNVKTCFLKKIRKQNKKTKKKKQTFHYVICWKFSQPIKH